MIKPTDSSYDPVAVLQESWNYKAAVAKVEAIIALMEAGGGIGGSVRAVYGL